MPRNTRALAGLALRKAVAEYKAVNPEPRDADTAAVLERLENARKSENPKDIEAVAAFAAIHARFDHEKAGNKRPTGLLELYLIGVLVRAVKLQWMVADYAEAEEEATAAIADAQRGLELLFPFICLMAKETYGEDKPIGFDYDLVPHWEKGQTTAEKVARRREVLKMLQEQGIPIDVTDYDPLPEGEVGEFESLDAAYTFLRKTVLMRYNWGRSRSKALQLHSLRDTDKLDFATRAALRDLVASLAVCAPDTKRPAIRKLASLIFSKEISIHQVRDAEAGAAERNAAKAARQRQRKKATPTRQPKRAVSRGAHRP